MTMKTMNIIIQPYKRECNAQQNIFTEQAIFYDVTILQK